MNKLILEEPQPPESNECCGSGSCCPCVWDYYREQHALWRAQQANKSSDPVMVPHATDVGSTSELDSHSDASCSDGGGGGAD